MVNSNKKKYLKNINDIPNPLWRVIEKDTAILSQHYNGKVLDLQMESPNFQSIIEENEATLLNKVREDPVKKRLESFGCLFPVKNEEKQAEKRNIDPV